METPVKGPNFIGEELTILNTAGPDKHQAVALAQSKPGQVNVPTTDGSNGMANHRGIVIHKSLSDTAVMTIINSYIGHVIHPNGWLDWNSRSKLNSIDYVEYQNISIDLKIAHPVFNRPIGAPAFSSDLFFLCSSLDRSSSCRFEDRPPSVQSSKLQRSSFVFVILQIVLPVSEAAQTSNEDREGRIKALGYKVCSFHTLGDLEDENGCAIPVRPK
ncbi:hypothetical protein SO802_008052 [Lithocarpus litseifolius]|uniref:Pectinesterase catalytic domain-containing protein n=1 Tax=Lithocarpus litseifolius TaxID=425828 RepID=A0AAW2DBE7_9ROSI